MERSTLFAPKVIERELVQEFDVSASVAWWNYWDHEHVSVVHRGLYEDLQILHEDERSAVCLTTFRVPVFRFIRSHSLDVMIQQDPRTLLVYNLGLFGVPSKTTIRIEEDREDHCVFNMRYRFLLSGWTRVLGPFLPRLIESWNDRVWQEDVPLKSRRQRVLKLGFRDFVGLPDAVSDRKAASVPDLELPLPRLPGSHVDRVRELLDG